MACQQTQRGPSEREYSEYDRTHHQVCTTKPTAWSKYQISNRGDVELGDAIKGRTAMLASTVKHTGTQQCQQTSGIMPLLEFVAQHAADLPLRVKVHSGYYGSNSHLTISAGEILNVYCKKDTTVVTAQIQNNTLSIPLNSNLQFSLLHPAEATEGCVYYSVADLLAANPQPKVVCCVENKSRRGLVQEKEVLILAASQGSTQNLRAFSTLTKADKLLPPDLPAVFSTHPDLVPLYLTDLLTLVPNLFPCSSVISNAAHVPNTLLQVNTLLGMAVESALLCSSDGSNQLFDFPLNIPGVEVIVLPMQSEAEKKDLYSKARDVIANFNPGNIQVFNDSRTRVECELQSFLFSNVRVGFENAGIALCGSAFVSSVFGSSHRPSAQFSKEGRNSPPKNLNPPAEYSISRPMQHNMIQSSKVPRSTVDSQLTDIDEISPAYATQRHPGHFSRGSSSSSLCLDTTPTVQEEVCLSLHRFADKYSERLPLSFQIQNGTHHEKLFHVSKADVFTVHFIAAQPVISFKDMANNTYVLPLTAASQFGVVHTSEHNPGYAEFETVGNILDAAKLPKVVCARRAFQGGNATSSVEVNEILIIQKPKKMKKVLKVYSITANMKKYLASKCKGHFTTAPESAKLSIQKVYEHLLDALPLRMVVYPENQELPSHLSSQQVAVISYHPKDSLIVSPVNLDRKSVV